MSYLLLQAQLLTFSTLGSKKVHIDCFCLSDWAGSHMQTLPISPCRKEMLVQRTFVSMRMFIVFMGTFNCSCRKKWHSCVSLVIIINKQETVTEGGSFFHSKIQKNNRQSRPLLRHLLFHVATMCIH